jgi:Na+/melibiose symporter-like transporter
MSHHKQQEHHLKPYKMAAQSMGTLVSFFFVLVVLGKGLTENSPATKSQLITLVLCLLVPVSGYIITWYKEKAGGLLMIAGGILLLIYYFSSGEKSTAFLYSIPFIISGALYLLHVKKRRDLQRRDKTDQSAGHHRTPGYHPRHRRSDDAGGGTAVKTSAIRTYANQAQIFYTNFK